MSDIPEDKEPLIIKTMSQLKALFADVLIMADHHILELLCDAIIANVMGLGPVWVVIIAPPSGGKSEILMAFFDLKEFVYPLSSLTPQTLISGAHMAGGGSASLLDEINHKVVIMKDLTTIVEMNKEDLRAILGQLREVYDKQFDKAFGTGERKNWEGHVGWIGAITPAGATSFQAHGAMGERFIFYRLAQPDRMEVLRKSAANQALNMELQQMRLKKGVFEYLAPILEFAKNMSAEQKKVVLENETLEEIFELANFATLARSSVRLHWKTQEVEYVYPPEMPTRFSNQLVGMAGGTMTRKLFEKQPLTLNKEEMKRYTGIAWGSIPPHRADVIKLLAKYAEASTQAVGAELRYETSIVRPWLSELAGLKIVKRRAKTSSGGPDIWYMEKKWRELVCKLEGIQMLDVAVEDAGADDDDYDPDLSAEELERQVLAQQASKHEQEFENLDPNTGELPWDDTNPAHPDYY